MINAPNKPEVLVADSGVAGPTVWLTAAVHGDEVGGTAVLHDLFDLFKSEPLKRGTVKAIPVANPDAWHKTQRLLPQTNEDLNDFFPGLPEGGAAEQLAYKIYTTITADAPQLVIDLHNDWRQSVAYLLLDPLSVTNPAALDEARRLAEATGLPVIREQEYEAEDSRHTLSGSLVAAGFPSFTLELGEAGVVNESQVRIGMQALWNALAALDMVDDRNNLADLTYPSTAIGKELLYAETHSPGEGLIRFLVKPGDLVEAGEELARIFDPLNKTTDTKIPAEHAGLVVALTDAALATPNAPLVALGLLPN